MDAIISVDENQRIVLYNRSAERIFGWPAEEVKGQPLELLIPERFRTSHAAHVKRFGETGVTSRRMGATAIVSGRRANGEEFPVDASISQLDTPEGKLFTVILRDVTERVRARDDLAAFASQANAILEQEKGRVARELHDELAQSLTALKMDTIWVRDNYGTDPAGASRKLQEMLGMLDASVAATRRIAADLRPLLLDDLGLVPAIEWLVQNFTQRTGTPCELEIDQALELQEPYATAVFRIVQECLANVAKHAGASRADVSLARDDCDVLLRVRDDGAGFIVSGPRKPTSLGLTGVRERAQLLKGEVHVDSNPGLGTRVHARIPIGVWKEEVA